MAIIQGATRPLFMVNRTMWETVASHPSMTISVEPALDLLI
jgi:hypothetical protein